MQPRPSAETLRPLFPKVLLGSEDLFGADVALMMGSFVGMDFLFSF
jgi:hypothetical protein